MAIKTVYVRPNDQVKIRVVMDDNLSLCAGDFHSQPSRRQGEFLLHIHNSYNFSFSNPAYEIDYTTAFGKVIKSFWSNDKV